MTALRSALALMVLLGLLGACTDPGSVPRETPSPSEAPLPHPASPEPPRSPGSTQAPLVIGSHLDTSGAADVSVALQAIVDAAPDGSRLVFPSDAVFRLDEGLRVDGRRDLVLEGNGATLVTDGCERESSLISVGLTAPSTDITIRGLTLTGANDRAGTSSAFDAVCQFQAGVALYGAARVAVEEMVMSGMRGDCLYVGGAKDGTWSSDVTFRDSECRANGRQGVAIVAGERISIERLDLDTLAMHVLDIEPNDGLGGARDVVFRDNRVGTYGHSDAYTGFFFGANGSLDAPVDRVLVSGNLVTEDDLHTLVGDEFTGWDGQRNRRSIEVSGNTSTIAANGPVLTFKHVDGLVVRDNTQPLSGGQLVRLVDVTGAVIE